MELAKPKVRKVHHVAYRCADANETARFYTERLGLEFSRAIVQDRVPSLGEACPHIHVFFTLADGSSIAFFELRDQPPAARDPNTPEWVQHIAMEVADDAALQAARVRLEAGGIEVVGVTEHGFCRSIYFFDPSGHRLELTVRHDDPGEAEAAAGRAWQELAHWERDKNARRAAAPGHRRA